MVSYQGSILARPQLWTPIVVSGLVQWVKADQITASDGDAVATWSDQSGAGKDFTQSTAANKPTYKTNIVNGQPVVRGDGVNDFMTSALPTSANATFTMFMVVSNRATGTATQCPYFNGTGGTNGYGLAVSTTANTKGFLYGGVAWQNSAVAESTAWDVYVVRNTGASCKLWVNGGASIKTVASNPTAPTTEAALFNHVGGGGGGVFCDADLFELGVYNTNLSNADVDNLGNYLARRIGASWTASS